MRIVYSLKDSCVLRPAFGLRKSSAFRHVDQCAVAVPWFIGIFFPAGEIHHSISALQPRHWPRPLCL